MVVTARMIFVLVALLVAATGIVLWLVPREPVPPSAALAAAVAATVAAVAAVALRRRGRTGRGALEPDDIREVSDGRRRELLRGTSLFLREMQYRYSVRPDPRASHERCFSAEVNTIRLGFIPAVVTDNTNDRQGAGFVAFVHDGRRWRGPGLPCPADQVEAVRHAARCVSPLATDEETSFEQDDEPTMFDDEVE